MTPADAIDWIAELTPSRHVTSSAARSGCASSSRRRDLAAGRSWCRPARRPASRLVLALADHEGAPVRSCRAAASSTPRRGRSTALDGEATEAPRNVATSASGHYRVRPSLKPAVKLARVGGHVGYRVGIAARCTNGAARARARERCAGSRRTPTASLSLGPLYRSRRRWPGPSPAVTPMSWPGRWLADRQALHGHTRAFAAWLTLSSGARAASTADAPATERASGATMPRSPAASPALSKSSASRPLDQPAAAHRMGRRLATALAAVRPTRHRAGLADRVFALALDGFARDVRAAPAARPVGSAWTIDRIARTRDDLWFAAGWIRHLLVTDVGLVAAEIRQLFDAIRAARPATRARSPRRATGPTFAPEAGNQPDDIDPGRRRIRRRATNPHAPGPHDSQDQKPERSAYRATRRRAVGAHRTPPHRRAPRPPPPEIRDHAGVDRRWRGWRPARQYARQPGS